MMPTFHHWKTGNKRYGITFHTAADARAFDKGVTMAIQDVLDGKNKTFEDAILEAICTRPHQILLTKIPLTQHRRFGQNVSARDFLFGHRLTSYLEPQRFFFKADPK